MIIRTVAHKGLRRFLERDEPSGIDPSSVEKVRNILSFLLEMETPEELRRLPHWNAHRLTGDRKGTWSLSVSRNWRITFWIDSRTQEIHGLNLEDYH